MYFVDWWRLVKRLSVNIDHIATLRQARRVLYPEVSVAAGICEIAGADGITCHLREDRRHIQDRDVFLLAQTLTTKLNLEMAATDEMLDIALNVKPHMVTFVPERRHELTTEGGLNIRESYSSLSGYIESLKKENILTCLFVDPDCGQIDLCKTHLDCDYLEIHTGPYCDAPYHSQAAALKVLQDACSYAKDCGFLVNAGHGITYHNVAEIACIKEIEELSIGHGIIAHAVFVGLERAVKEMKACLNGCP